MAKTKEIKVGDKVKYKAEYFDDAPEEHEDDTFAVRCDHGDHVFLLSPGEFGFSGAECSQHGNMWEANKNMLRVVGKASEKRKHFKVDPKYLDKVALRPDSREDILAMLAQGSKAATIFDKWGLGETIEYGRGMTALFWGPPGTGKTWLSHCIAKAIGKELMVLSVGEIQSSMAGETNKNIEKAFKAAKEGDKVLLLDEADSFVGDRKYLGMILSSEINTLLQQIEKFEGLVILTTNQIGNLDPALERRLNLIMEFKNPTLEERKQIWSILMPKKFPLHKDVSIDSLAEHKLTGGFIKNVMLHAARLAASEDAKTVSKEHFDRAIKRTQDSQGKMGTRGMHAVTDYKIGGSA